MSGECAELARTAGCPQGPRPLCSPDVAVGDGARGFWNALEEVFPGTRHQRCWTHKVSNVLNKFPKSMHLAVKADLREV